ncbi:hypothetical protein CROQUDRAFT_626006 [Cronartium quercuum f. sp. fusiforme G11]|uniref:SAP domain-containing protein n=1 Tax=Cronartium quercuum f. sp. fusiforme G11 TaxID=708437 RepID=A0A9P6NED1_9BASI|nr:hypothetical protein CROQUDRAFT_626006 [Cronartium quercuum f. sp. fusiforme G11]
MVNVSKLKVVEIKAELVARGLPTSGLKAVLAQRLTEALQAEEEQKTTAEAAHSKNLGLTSTSELLPLNSIEDPIPSSGPNKSTTPSPNSRKRKQPLASTDDNPLPSKSPCSSRLETGTSETNQKPESADQLTVSVLPDSTVVGRSKASPISTEPHELDNHQPDQSDFSEIAITPSLAQVPPPEKNDYEMASVTIAKAELTGHPDQTRTPESSTGPLKPSTAPAHTSTLIEARDPESESAIPSAVVATGIASEQALSVTVSNVDQTPPNTAPHVDKTELAEKLHVDSSQQQAMPMPAESLTVESTDSNIPKSSESAVTIVVPPNDDSSIIFDHNPDTIVEIIPETSHLPKSDNLNTKPIGSNAASLSRSDLNLVENVPAVTAHDEKLDTDLTPPSVNNFSPPIPSQTVTPACSIPESSSQIGINLSGHTPLIVTPHIRAIRSPSVIIENTGKHDQESIESQSMMPADSNDSDLRASSQTAEHIHVALASVPEPSPKPSTSQVNSKQPIGIETKSSLPDASSTTPPPNKSLYINNLVRPLTIPQIKNMLSEFVR